MQQNPLSPGEPGFDYLEYLHVLYYEQLMYFAYRMLNDEITAEEIVIEAFLNVKKAHPDLAAIKDIRNYLFIIVRNMCYAAIKEKKLRENYLKDVAAQPPSYTEMEIFLHESLQIEELIEIVLSELTPSQRKIIKMSFLEEKSVKKIANELGRTENGVAAEKSKALRKLKENKDDLPNGLTFFLLAALYLQGQNFF